MTILHLQKISGMDTQKNATLHSHAKSHGCPVMNTMEVRYNQFKQLPAPHPYLVQVLHNVSPVNDPPRVPLSLVEHKIAEQLQQVGVPRVAGCGAHVR